MKRLLAALGIGLAVVTLATACAPSRNVQMTETDGLVFHLSYGSWKWYVANSAENGKAWYPYMNWSTDECSAPLVGNSPWNFSTACKRHDFSWRNLKRIDAAFPSSPDVWKGRNKNAADLQFNDDLNSRCGEHGWWYRAACYPNATLYFTAVNVIPPYAAPWDAFKQGFVW